jgi:ABC-type multidrug transport system fused ATPase/permease subunit
MDVITERTAMDFIAKHFSQHTIVVIAHRLETIRDFDRVAVMDAGKVVEYDTPDALSGKIDGAFRALWEHETGRQNAQA